MTKVCINRWARLLAVPTGLAVVLLLIPSPASAHATVVSTNPRDGQVVATAPRTISVTFNEAVRVAPEGMQLLDATGKPVPHTVKSLDNQVTYTPSRSLADGTYIVSWRVVSADTHPVAGGISFSVGEPSKNVIAVPGRGGHRDVSLLKVIAEIARYAGVLGLAGLLAFATYLAPAARRRSTDFSRRIDVGSRLFAASAVLGSVLLIPLVKLWQDGQRLSQLFSASMWSDALKAQPAAAAGMVITGVAIAWLAHRRQRPTALAVGLALALSSVAVVGHTRVYGPPSLLLTADLLHVTAAALWLGGIIGICLLLAPGSRVRAGDAAEAVGTFSSAALWFVLALGATSVLLWWRIAASVDALWTTTYGRLVLIKLVLVLVIVGVAVHNRRRLVPRVTSNPHDKQAMGALRRTVAWEAAVLVAVITVTGALVSQTPRTAAAAQPAPAERTLRAPVGDAKATLVLTPARRGTNSLQVTLVDADGAPLEPFETPEVSVALQKYELGPFKHPLSKTGTGTFEASVDFTLKGTWTVTLSVRLSEFENPVVSRKVVIP